MPKTSEKHSSQIKGRRGGARPGAGRPRGRKSAKTIEIESAAKVYAGDALKALAYIAMHGEIESARVSAATALLDRGYGRPRQAVEHTGESGGPVMITVTHRVVDPAA
jgi:hypothetical protein